ncbi:MAG: glycosyltransferase [Acidimicrobiia bacterium]
MTSTLAPASVDAVVDVVVVAYRSADVIDRCLGAACRIHGVGQVIVVDHGDDESGAIATLAGATVLAHPDNPGFGAGQNRGFERGTSRYVLVLNPDAAPRAEGIAAGVRYLDAHPEVAIVQGVVRDSVTSEPDRSQGRELGVLHLLGRATGARRLARWSIARWVAARIGALRDHVERIPMSPTGVEALAATAWLARRDALANVGGFDEEYFLYGEDLDLCRRLRGAGWKIVALPHEWAMHDQGSSAASSFERELTWWRGTLRFAGLWWTTPQRFGALVVAFIRGAGLALQNPRAVRRIWRSTVGAALGARTR